MWHHRIFVSVISHANTSNIFWPQLLQYKNLLLSFSCVIVNEVSLGFGLLVSQMKQLKASLWDLGNCNEQFSAFCDIL